VTTAPPPIDIDIGTPIGPISITCPVGPGPSPTCPVVCPGGTFGV
jgi:hypothetical protein